MAAESATCHAVVSFSLVAGGNEEHEQLLEGSLELCWTISLVDVRLVLSFTLLLQVMEFIRRASLNEAVELAMKMLKPLKLRQALEQNRWLTWRTRTRSCANRRPRAEGAAKMTREDDAGLRRCRGKMARCDVRLHSWAQSEHMRGLVYQMRFPWLGGQHKNDCRKVSEWQRDFRSGPWRHS